MEISTKFQSTILIVDDEPRGRKNLKILLLNENYNLMFAENGSEALELAVNNPPDVILLDVMMPGMDGYEVCRRVRANATLADVPVILLTALDDRASRLEGIEAGADDFISKPFDRLELRLRVQTIIRLNRYRRLLTERNKFQWAIEQAEDGYVVTDVNDHVLYANPQACLYLDLPIDQGVTDTFLTLIQNHYQLEPLAAWTNWPQAFKEIVPICLVQPASKVAPAFWLQVDVMEMDGGAERYLIRLRDVTSTIEEQRLMWSFHTQISHKLRTPLSHLAASLEVLQTECSSALQPEAGELLHLAYNGAKHLQNELQNVFKYIETAGMIYPSENWCSIVDVLDVIADIETSLALEPILIQNELQKEPGDVYLRPSRSAMELIWLEILKNAQTFHPQQSPALEIKIAPAPNDIIRIQICDDGVTLSPRQLNKIWTPYYQAEKYFTGQVQGTGLGLAKVASLVLEVGGTCRAYNRSDGPGLIIEFSFPSICPDEPIIESDVDFLRDLS